MSKDITYKQYHDEIESIVKNCFDPKEYDDTDEDTWTDRLHEIVDGHQWVIYNAYHFDVLKLSRNDGAIDDVGFDGRTSLTDILTLATYLAMEADCMEYFSDNRDAIVKEENERD